MKLFIACLRICIIGFIMLNVVGCVSQYQREYLGDSIMYFGRDAEEESLKGHIYPRREGTSGGESVAGGGCGC